MKVKSSVERKLVSARLKVEHVNLLTKAHGLGLKTQDIIDDALVLYFTKVKVK